MDVARRLAAARDVLGIAVLDHIVVGDRLPTPWVGVWERINLGVFLLWVVVLATALLRARDTASETGRLDAAAA